MIKSETTGSGKSLQALFESSGRQLTWWQTGANLIGALIVTSYFVFFDQVFPAIRIKNTFYFVGVMFPVLVLIAISSMRNWQRDLNLYVRLHGQNRAIAADLQKSAQRKILDVPYRSALVSFFCWFLAAIAMTTYSLVSEINGADTLAGEIFESLRVFTGCIIGGIIVAAIGFFNTEAKCRQLWPYFFPQGGLVRTPGAFRLKLRIRMFVIFLLSSILPLMLMAVLSYNKARMMLIIDPTEVIQSLLYLTAFLLAVTLAVTIIFSRLFSTGIIDPVGRMQAAMAKVEKGDLTASVTVNSNDELGALAENFNQMTEGLKDRYRMQQALDLAKEVQQNLLPDKNPQFPGLDIAGKSIYCDETGGDYFDFFNNVGADSNTYGVVIGDVSEHGIPSALLMASTRAFLRQRSALSGSIADVVSDVNRQLTRDVENTGRFITLFYLQIDRVNHRLSWVRAGHEPAVFYDPAAGRFEELTGKGIALGIEDSWRYTGESRADLAAGQIILLSTDGIWEARNPRDEMFGKQAMYEIIRKHSDGTAAEIQEAILAELSRFQEGVAAADDITLVVIKINEDI